MKVSLNLIRHMAKTYGTGVDPYSFGVDEVVKRTGLQLGAIEDVVKTGSKYEGIIVAKVVECDKHPNADKLSLCLIDDGRVNTKVERNEQGLVQVVCGAPNVKAGITVAWIPPEVAVPSSADDDPFVLEAREIRGKVSNGMLASPSELAISDEHNGILEIDTDNLDEEPAKPGTEFKKLFDLDDVIIDCENKMFTHRPDCFGTLGVGREISGIFGEKFTSPEWYKQPIRHEVDGGIELVVDNQVPELVPRFTVQAMTGVQVGPSPMWLQVYLNNIGIKSINNIVDYTNFFMMETGQPLHAFDYDKLQKYSDQPSIGPRMAKKGEKITLLGGKTIELDETDMVIATDKQAVALAGVMGGMDTEVDDQTQAIVIECANFDMYAVRRTSMRHGLFTDAVTRFNKGQSPLQNGRVIAKMVEEVKTYAGGKVASKMYDLASFDLSKDNLNHVEVTVGFINDRLGSDLNAEDMKTLLENVEFTVEVKDDVLSIVVPFWRMDIEIPEDVVEEIGRLYGYQNLPVELPARTSKPATKNAMREFKQTLRDQLVKAGANEVLTYSFVHGDLLRNTGTDPDQWAHHLRNALSPDLQYYRTSVVPSLLAKVHGNLKAQAGSDSNEFALFEIGKAHVKGHNEEDEDGLPKQMRRLAMVIAADAKTAKKYSGSAYYQAKKYLDLVTNGQAVYQPLETTDYPITAAYQTGRSAMVSVGGQVLGVIGEFHSKARKSLKLPDFCAGFELDVDLLMQTVSPRGYKQLSTFPSSTQDVTFEVGQDTSWDELMQLVDAELKVVHATKGLSADVEPMDIFVADGSDKKRLSMRITLSHSQKTLKTQEVSTVIANIEKVAHEKLQAVRI